MASALRKWLQKHPHPHTVRGYDADDNERMAKLTVARSKWSDAESALSGCWKLEALDVDGNVLRIWESEEEKPEPKRAANSELVELARLISNAHDAGAARHEAAYRLGFEHLAALVKVLSERLNGIERAYHRQILADARDAVGPEASADDMVKQFLGAMAVQHLANTNGAAPEPKGDE